MANPGLNRRDETILNRLRIGHTFATHNHLMAEKTLPYANHVGGVHCQTHTY